MKRDEWQLKFGLLDDEMAYLSEILRVFEGRIVKIAENPDKILL